MSPKGQTAPSLVWQWNEPGHRRQSKALQQRLRFPEEEGILLPDATKKPCLNFPPAGLPYRLQAPDGNLSPYLSLQPALQILDLPVLTLAGASP